jgi:peptide/nickel transport system substrate-binding protein
MHISKILPILCLAGAVLLCPSCKLDSPKEDNTSKVYNDLDRPLEEAILHLDAEPDRLLPMLTTSNYARSVYSGLFAYLLFQDPQTLEIIPQLATSRPEIEEITEGENAGGLAYTFEIREEASWDNGSPVTGEDYIFTMKALFNPKIPATAYRVYLSFIKDIRLDPENPRRFTVYTNQRYIIGEEAIGAALPILPAYHYDPDGLMKDISLASLADEKQAQQLADSDERLQTFADQFTSPRFSREADGVSGAGPYQLTKWETGQRIILERKSDWWGDSVEDANISLAAYPEKLIFRPISEGNTAVTALKDGKLDAMANIPPKRFDELKETDFVKERFDFFSPPSLVNTFIYLNTRIPKLQDKKVRKALAHAINADEIIETAFFGYGERTATPVHPSFSFYNNELDLIPYSPETARSLLAEAGWSDTNNNGIVDKEVNGQRVEMSLTYHYTAGRSLSENIALLIQEAAKPAGIEIKPVPQDFAVTQEALGRREFELVGGAKIIQSTPWEPKQDFHSDGDDRTGFATPETDALIDQIQVTIDKEAREKLYLDLQAAIYDATPIIYIMVPQSRIVIHKRFETEVTPIFPGYLPQLLKLEETK